MPARFKQKVNVLRMRGGPENQRNSHRACLRRAGDSRHPCTDSHLPSCSDPTPRVSQLHGCFLLCVPPLKGHMLGQAPLMTGLVQGKAHVVLGSLPKLAHDRGVIPSRKSRVLARKKEIGHGTGPYVVDCGIPQFLPS